MTVDWHGELYYRKTKHYNSDLGPREEWDEKAGKMTAVFGNSLKRVASPLTT